MIAPSREVRYHFVFTVALLIYGFMLHRYWYVSDSNLNHPPPIFYVSGIRPSHLVVKCTIMALTT
jgi:hypothetical protein